LVLSIFRVPHRAGLQRPHPRSRVCRVNGCCVFPRAANLLFEFRSLLRRTSHPGREASGIGGQLERFVAEVGIDLCRSMTRSTRPGRMPARTRLQYQRRYRRALAAEGFVRSGPAPVCPDSRAKQPRAPRLTAMSLLAG